MPCVQLGSAEITLSGSRTSRLTLSTGIQGLTLIHISS